MVCPQGQWKAAHCIKRAAFYERTIAFMEMAAGYKQKAGRLPAAAKARKGYLKTGMPVFR
ncbi:hypothetical protein A7P95_01055 [Eikenella longinqua]|uniref:Uncharacterized protein n=1 Tax=Eikenella longinqua TaxID=1795827 RepID=A0A1A9S1Z7_9NEIS|nr:hypothetical protein A7P95_01055 [Eikenella longinqua]